MAQLTGQSSEEKSLESGAVAGDDKSNLIAKYTGWESKSRDWTRAANSNRSAAFPSRMYDVYTRSVSSNG